LTLPNFFILIRFALYSNRTIFGDGVAVIAALDNLEGEVSESPDHPISLDICGAGETSVFREERAPSVNQCNNCV
jgi:hypothetical protein